MALKQAIKDELDMPKSFHTKREGATRGTIGRHRGGVGLLAFSKASETGANRPLSIIFPLIGVGFDQFDMGAIDQLLSRVWKIHCYIHVND